MGNNLSTEEPQHVKTLKSKPNVREEPALQYQSAGWGESEFDDDAEEFSFASFKEPPDHDDDDEQEASADHRADRHTSGDDFKNIQIRRGRREERSTPRPGGTRKERKHSRIEDRRGRRKRAEVPQIDTTSVDLERSLSLTGRRHGDRRHLETGKYPSS